MYSKPGSRFPTFFRLIAPIFALSILSCQPGPFDPTSTPTNFPSATPTICPSITIATPGPSTNKAYLIIALFEDNPSHRDKTNKDANLLADVLGDYAEPGDYILMVRMEPYTLNDAAFVQQKVASLQSTPIPPTPTQYPTNTTIPSPFTTPSTRLGQTAIANDSTATAQVALATATYTNFLHLCAMNQWESEYLEIQKIIEGEKSKIRQETKQRIDEEKKLHDDPIARTAVWNGLGYASQILENECEHYSRCFVIIFSDMDETSDHPSSLKLKLDNAEVLVIMRNCQFLFSGQCGFWKSYWETYLKDRVKSIEFINENADETIEALLKR